MIRGRVSNQKKTASKMAVRLTSKQVLYLRGVAKDFTAACLRPECRGSHLLRRAGGYPRVGPGGAGPTDDPIQSAVSSLQKQTATDKRHLASHLAPKQLNCLYTKIIQPGKISGF